MSLEQHKDANRTELWNILQIQAQVLEEEIRKNTELEKELRNSTELLVKGANKIKELELKQRDIIRDIKVCFGHAIACDGSLLVNVGAYNLLVATCNAKIKENEC